MCGIAGFNGFFPPDLLSKMVGAIAHRGPDDQGQWFSTNRETALGHVRLSIIDLSPD